jgi:hypothetical protein
VVGAIFLSQVRYVFAFADTQQQLSVDEDSMRKLLKALYVSAKGLGAPTSLMLAVGKMKRDAGGNIPLSEFNKLCLGAPSLLFPVARLQVGEIILRISWHTGLCACIQLMCFPLCSKKWHKWRWELRTGPTRSQSTLSNGPSRSVQETWACLPEVAIQIQRRYKPCSWKCCVSAVSSSSR